MNSDFVLIVFMFWRVKCSSGFRVIFRGGRDRGLSLSPHDASQAFSPCDHRERLMTWFIVAPSKMTSSPAEDKFLHRIARQSLRDFSAFSSSRDNLLREYQFFTFHFFYSRLDDILLALLSGLRIFRRHRENYNESDTSLSRYKIKTRSRRLSTATADGDTVFYGGKEDVQGCQRLP